MLSSIVTVALAVAAAVSAGTTAYAQAPAESQITVINETAMPDVRGKLADEAKATVEKAGVYGDFDIRFDRTPPGDARIGTVTRQEPEPGEEVTSGVGDPEPVLLEVAGPPLRGRYGCAAAAPLQRATRDMDLDVGLKLLRQGKFKANLDFTINRRRSGTGSPHSEGEPEIDRSTLHDRCGGTVDATISGHPADQGLLFHVAPANRRLTFSKDWALTAGTTNTINFQLLTRAGQALAGARVIVDASDAGGKDVVGTTPATGTARLRITPKRPGVIDVVGAAQGADGNTWWGTMQLRVQSARDRVVTFLNQTFGRQDDGRFKLERSARSAQQRDDEQRLRDACDAITATDCGTNVRGRAGLLVLDTDEPVSDDFGVARVDTQPGVEVIAGSSDIRTVDVPEIVDVIGLGAAGASPIRAAIHKKIWKKLKNVLTYVAPVASGLVSTFFGPVAGAAFNAVTGAVVGKERVRPRAHAIHSAMQPLAGVVPVAPPEVEPPAGLSPTVDLPLVPVPSRHPTAPPGTQELCDFFGGPIGRFLKYVFGWFPPSCQDAA